MTKPNIGELVFFWILFGVAGVLSFFVMTPYLSGLFLSVVMTVLFLPVFRKIHAMIGKGRAWPALITVLLALAIILVPVIFFGILMFQEVVNIYVALTQPGSTVVSDINGATTSFERFMQHYIPQFALKTNVTSYLQSILSYVATNLNSFFSGIIAIVIDLFIIIGAMFFFYRDGEKLHNFAVKWSPLADRYDESLIKKLEIAISAVVSGALFVSVIQGFTIGIGFAVFGLPNPVLWGAVSVIAALIPIVGTAIITIPAGLYLIFQGSYTEGVLMLIYGGVIVGTIDNLIRPLFIKRGVDIHPFVILLSVLGGLVYFGPIGFLAGPITIAFFYALLDIYPAIVSGKQPKETTDVVSS
jgi:predicted PurR-regulated permease PerM